MENSIYVGLSRSVALQREMDTVSNNIANMNTPGYRGQHMMFKEYVEDPRGIMDPLSMVLDYGQFMSNKPGAMKLTGNKLDVALQGPGFMHVQGPGGETMYTRAGNFKTTVSGELVTAEGNPVLSNGGGPITIPAGTTDISIAEDGTISNQDGVVGQIGMTEFPNINELDAVGDSMYRASENANGQPAQETRMVQGLLEGSNVNSIVEMTRMIDVHRSYQSVQRMLQTEHDRQRGMIQRLTQQS